jgi:hypothetical protein
MLHCGRNLPPDVKRNQRRNGAARKLQDFAHLQRVEFERLKTDANLKRTIDAQSRFAPLQCLGARLRLGQGRWSNHDEPTPGEPFHRHHRGVQISTSCEQRMHGGRRSQRARCSAVRPLLSRAHTFAPAASNNTAQSNRSLYATVLHRRCQRHSRRRQLEEPTKRKDIPDCSSKVNAC